MLHKRIFMALLAWVIITPVSFAYDNNEAGGGKEYKVDLAPLNSSGVYGKVEISTKGNKLSVSIEAQGLEPGKVHPQHIHGFNNPVKQSTCPGIEADTNADGIVSVGEGAPAYGPIIIPLTPFDLVEDSGKLEYEVSVTVDTAALEPLEKRAVILHGMTVNGQYIPSLPVSCGVVHKDD